MSAGAWLAAPAALALAAIVAAAIGSLPSAARPQRTSGDDALSVAFGDAKVTIGRAMLRQADSYFHGGVDMDGHHDCLNSESHDHPHADHCNNRQPGPFDPWRWINAHIRAPEIERHLEGRRAVELIPWLWAAVKANPKDTDTWTTAWYIAARQMRDAKLARTIAAEGLRLNPLALDIACVSARGFRESDPSDPKRAEAEFRRAHDLALGKCGGDPAQLGERDRESFLEILNYLAAYEGDKTALNELVREAAAVNPHHAVTCRLRERCRQAVRGGGM